MTVYISGPITGHDDYKATFAAAQADLEARGYVVHNPAKLEIDGGTWADYMRHDIRELLECTSIFMLPGWMDSNGATLEHLIATSLELDFIDGSAAS